MELKETFVSRQEIFHGRIVDLRVDTVRLPNGHLTTREVIDHPGGVAVVAIDENDKPRLIEFNVSSYGIPLAQMTLGPTFGHFTDEIIDYCREHRRQAHKVFVRRT